MNLCLYCWHKSIIVLSWEIPHGIICQEIIHMASVPNQEKYAFNECIVPDKSISRFVLENP